jgi:hypothetical protein
MDDLQLIDTQAQPDIQLVDTQAQTAKLRASAGIEANPDEAAKAIKIGQETGQDPNIVGMDVKASTMEQKINSAMAAVDYPAVASFLNEYPLAHKVANDDYDNLKNFADAAQKSSALYPLSGGFEAFGSGFTSGYLSQDRARLGLAYQVTGLGGDRLSEIEKQLADQPKYDDYSAKSFTQNIGSFLGMLTSSSKVGATTAGAGALVGGPAGAIAGFVGGVTADFIASQSGSTYRDASLLRDKNGAPIPETVKQVAAITSGIATGLILTATGGAGKLAAGAVNKFILNAVSEPVINNMFARSVGAVAQAGISGGVLNTALAFSGEISQQLAKAGANTGNGQFETIFNSPHETARVMDDMMKSFVNGAALFGGMRTVPIGVGLLTDRAHIAQTNLDAAQREQLFQLAQASKLRARSPEAYGAFLDRALGADTVRIPADKMQEILTKNPDYFTYVSDIKEQVDKGVETGEDVSIPARDYYSKTDPAAHEAVKDDIRGQNGLTINEGKDLEKAPHYDEGLTQTDWYGLEEPRIEAEKAAEEARVTHEAAPTPETERKLAELQARAKDLAERQDAIAEAFKEQDKTGVPARATLISDSLETRVDAEKRGLFLGPMFPDLAGMTKDNFTRYSRAIQRVQEKITKGAFDIATREIEKRETPLWKDRIEKEAEKVRDTIYAQRNDLHAADQLRGKDTVKLDPTAADDLHDEAGAFAGLTDRPTDALPKEFFEPGGLHPDELAQITGHANGREMLEQLIVLEKERKSLGESPKAQFERIVKEEAARRVEEVHGKLDDVIMREALDMALDVAQLDVLIEEFKALGGEITKEGIHDTVREDLLGQKAKDISKLNRLEEALARHGRDVEAKRENPVEAFKAKQRQIYAFERLRQAREFVKRFEAGRKIMDRFEGNRAVSGVHQDYTDVIHWLLREAGEKIPRSDANLGEALQALGLNERSALQEFAYKKLGEGRLVEQPDVTRLNPIPSPKEMTVDQLSQYVDALTSLYYVGRDEERVRIGDETFNRETIVDAIIKSVEASKPEEAVEGKVKHVGRTSLNLVLRPERLTDWWDQRDPLGPFNTYILRPLKAAQYRMNDIMTDLAGKFKELAKDQTIKKAFDQKLVNNELLDPATGKPMNLTRGHMLGIMANMGSESNYKVLAGGYGWDRAAIERFVDTNAKPADWAAVQKMWDMFAKYEPDVKAATKALSGVAVETVSGRKIKTANGVITGGYWPLMADRARAKVTMDFEALDRAYMNPFMKASSFKDRTGATYPVDLTMETLPLRAREMAHSIAFAEPLMGVKKLLGDDLVREAISKQWGKAYMQVTDGWLKHIIQNGERPGADEVGIKMLANGSRFMRGNAVTMLIGLRASTGFIHGGAAASNSIGEVGLANMARAYSQIRGPNRGDHLKMALEQSGELRNRMHNLDQDLGHMQDLALGQNKFMTGRAAFAKFSTSFIGWLDQESAVPTFMAARDRALSEGKSLEDAIYIGDKTVRNAHGASGLVDVPQLQRAAEGYKWFTMFYGYFNHNFNQLLDVGMRGKEAYNFWRDGDSPAAAKAFSEFMWKMMYYVAVPSVIHEAVRGHGKQDEDWADWGKRLLSPGSMALQIGSGIPLVRDVAAAWHGEREPSLTPLQATLRSFYDAGRDVQKTAQGKDPSAKWFTHMMQVPGFATGFGTNSLINLAQYGFDKASDDVDGFDLKRFILDMNPRPAKGH